MVQDYILVASLNVGAAITGIDFSEISINYARKEAQKADLDVKYILQDYLKFVSDEKFNLITMIFCDFCVLNSKQRQILLGKFFDFLEDNGKILLDVSSYTQYSARQESCSCEYSEKDGFWSPEPYYVFHNHFKYDVEHLLLDKFSIIEQSRIRENYNWLQCYDVYSITEELKNNGFKVTEHYANVAGDQYDNTSTEIAIIAEKS